VTSTISGAKMDLSRRWVFDWVAQYDHKTFYSLVGFEATQVPYTVICIISLKDQCLSNDTNDHLMKKYDFKALTPVQREKLHSVKTNYC
jgi:hypothetical protein